MNTKRITGLILIMAIISGLFIGLPWASGASGSYTPVNELAGQVVEARPGGWFDGSTSAVSVAAKDTDRYTGYVFRDIPIDRNASITSATLNLWYGSGYDWDTTNDVWVLVEGLRGAPLSLDYAGVTNHAATTAASSLYNISQWNTTQYYSIDVTDIVEEITDQFTWRIDETFDNIAFRLWAVAPVGPWAPGTEPDYYDFQVASSTGPFSGYEPTLNITWTVGTDTEQTYKGYDITESSGDDKDIPALLFTYGFSKINAWGVTRGVDGVGSVIRNISMPYAEYPALAYCTPLLLNDEIFMINDTGFIIRYWDEWEERETLAELPGQDGDLAPGWALCWDSLNELIHGVFHDDFYFFYFNMTLDGSTITAPVELYSTSPTAEQFRAPSIDTNDENGNNDIFIASAQNPAGSSSVGHLYAERISGAWATDFDTNAVFNPVAARVRFTTSDAGNVTILFQGPDRSGSYDSVWAFYRYDPDDGLASIPTFPTEWDRPSYGVERGPYTHNPYIFPNGTVRWALTHESQNSNFWSPSTGISDIPYTAGDSSINDDWHYAAPSRYQRPVGLAWVMGDPTLDASFVDIDYVYSRDYGDGNVTFYEQILNDENASLPVSSNVGRTHSLADIKDQALNFSYAINVQYYGVHSINTEVSGGWVIIPPPDNNDTSCIDLILAQIENPTMQDVKDAIDQCLAPGDPGSDPADPGEGPWDDEDPWYLNRGSFKLYLLIAGLAGLILPWVYLAQTRDFGFLVWVLFSNLIGVILLYMVGTV